MMSAVKPQTDKPCGVGDSTAVSAGSCGESEAAFAAKAAAGLDWKSPAAAYADRSYILLLQRQYPAAFAAVAGAAASTGQLQLLQDPLWLTAMGAAHVRHHSTKFEVPRNVEAADLSAAAEGNAVAAAIREAAKEAGGGNPLVRLQAAVLLGEAAALLHTVGQGLAVSSSQTSAAGYTSSASGLDYSQCLAAAAERAANALEMWHFRLMSLPVSISLVSLGSRGATPWKPRPCSAFSGAAATALLQLPAAMNELLLLHQQLRFTLGFLGSLDAYAFEKVQPLLIRCTQALQQVQQLVLHLMPPAATAKTGEGAAGDAATEAASEAEAVAADTATAVPADNTYGGVVLPPLTPSPSSAHDREMNLQLLLRSREAIAAPGLSKASSTDRRIQHRQQDVLHFCLKPLVLPLGNILWNLRSVGKRQTAQEVFLSRDLFLPTASPYWRGDFPCAANVAAGSSVESSFLLKHAAKLHALLTSSLRPELALR